MGIQYGAHSSWINEKGIQGSTCTSLFILFLDQLISAEGSCKQGGQRCTGFSFLSIDS
jgi:hypothetical protein